MARSDPRRKQGELAAQRTGRRCRGYRWVRVGPTRCRREAPWRGRRARAPRRAGPSSSARGPHTRRESVAGSARGAAHGLAEGFGAGRARREAPARGGRGGRSRGHRVSRLRARGVRTDPLRCQSASIGSAPQYAIKRVLESELAYHETSGAKTWTMTASESPNVRRLRNCGHSATAPAGQRFAAPERGLRGSGSRSRRRRLDRHTPITACGPAGGSDRAGGPTERPCSQSLVAAAQTWWGGGKGARTRTMMERPVTTTMDSMTPSVHSNAKSLPSRSST